MRQELLCTGDADLEDNQMISSLRSLHRIFAVRAVFGKRDGNGKFMKKQAIDGKYNVSGLQIKKIRKRMGLSQEALSGQMQTAGADITQKMISRIESGKRMVTDYELICFAKILGISVDELVNSEK